MNRALTTGSFPENLEEIGRAARETVARYRPYVTLIYVDVVEFEGTAEILRHGMLMPHFEQS